MQSKKKTHWIQWSKVDSTTEGKDETILADTDLRAGD